MLGGRGKRPELTLASGIGGSAPVGSIAVCRAWERVMGPSGVWMMFSRSRMGHRRRRLWKVPPIHRRSRVSVGRAMLVPQVRRGLRGNRTVRLVWRRIGQIRQEG
jgi:hypothetical protein